jgi:hypothetical protein
MTMTFPYVQVAAAAPVWPLGGRLTRPMPLLHVTLVGPTGAAVPRLSLLDDAASDTLFPEALAVQIGIDLSGAVTGTGTAVGGAVIPVSYAPVEVRVTDGVEFRAWNAIVGFTAAPLRWPLLGFAGFLQFFTTTFYGDREVVDLEVNRLYAGL